MVCNLTARTRPGLAPLLVGLLLVSARASEPSAPPEASASGRIDEILTRLQRRGDDLRDIRCRVVFEEEDRVNLTQRSKHGTILFLIAEPNPLFLIAFERTESEGIAGQREWYLFDGRWLHQAIERLAQVTQQEVVASGERFDPFDLESAPFPLPFGQKKDKILRNFDVALMSPAPGDPPNTDHLICTPKSESHLYRRYDKLEFFVDKDLHLPRRVVVTKNEGLEVNTATFPDLTSRSINAGVTRDDLAPPKDWKGYKVVVEPLPAEPTP